MFRARSSENKLRPIWKATLPDHAIGLSWSPDGKHLAAAAISGPMAVFDAATGKPAHQLKGHGFGTTGIAWQPSGTLLASAGQDGKVRFWNALEGLENAALEGGSSWVERLQWHPAGTLLAAGAG